MPDKPLLLLARPAQVERSRAGGGGSSVTRPSAGEQQQRLDAKFQQLADSFQALQATTQGLEPEQVIVLETIGQSVAGLCDAAAKIPGLEWLAEMDLGQVEPEHGYFDEKNPEKPLGCRLYAVLTSQQAMDQLLSLWQRWHQQPDQRAKRGFGPFKELFRWLRDVRRWEAQDRVAATGLLAYFQERLQEPGDIRFEIELWCRQVPASRQRAYSQLELLVQQAGGQCLSQAAIPEISYHGVLAVLPAAVVQQTVDSIVRQTYTQLLRCDDVMFFRPFAQARQPVETVEQPPAELADRGPHPAAAVGAPVVALLDGLPLAQHASLRDRLVIDDPDGFAEQYPPSTRQHGTAMGTLIVHGDLSRPTVPLQQPLYVRPIFQPQTDFQGKTYEAVPDNVLLVDLIHRAVRRIVAGDGEEPAAAPTVRIVNLSLGNRFQPFDRDVSPLGRLLDWLAWKYKLLFIVSAGNQADPIHLAVTRAEWRALDDAQRRDQTLRALWDGQLARRPYSPAETVNAVTVGALHTDDSTPLPHDSRTDLLAGARLPSPLSTVANGFRRSVKPEILLPGGRQYYRERPGAEGDPVVFDISDTFGPPGQLVGAPSTRPLELSRAWHMRGTSNATALATRTAAQIHEALVALRAETGGELLDETDWSVLLKCLLVHGAAWGSAATALDELFRPLILAANGDDRSRAAAEVRRLKSRFLGYGEVDLDRCLVCTDQRVILLGGARLPSDGAHVYLIPLPPALSAVKVLRRLTITLAWLTPVNFRNQLYRQAKLWCSVPDDLLAVEPAELDSDGARRGTVEHRLLEGSRAVAIADDGQLAIQVNCMEDARRLTDAVPYALAVTLEVAEPLAVSVYDQVRERIRPRVEVRPQPPR
jgi:hypothetical protein